VGVTPARAVAYRDVRRRLIRELHTAGVSIALGSDGFSLFHVPGFSTATELETLVAAGLTPFDALRAATVNVARLMGFAEPAGTIAKGGPADLVLLEANPLTDIAAVRRQNGVMIRGVWLPRAELDRRLAALTTGVGSR
jgi:imidazolonepropionase-like amidohydrolase